jgi:hypothetical protein
MAARAEAIVVDRSGNTARRPRYTVETYDDRFIDHRLGPRSISRKTSIITRIVQRLPVKILVTPGQPLAKLLRVSVETTIDAELEEVVNEQRKSSDLLTGR